MYQVARVGLHYFEEPCISGEQGSGTIFFCGCNLQCLFCQNYEISHGSNKGLDLSESQLIDCMKYLQDQGALNINLVTPSNYTNQLSHTLQIAKKEIKIPILWNSSGYETVVNLKKLEGLVDIYLPDFKYSNENLAWDYSHAKNYYDIAYAAISEMRRQQPKDLFNKDGIMKKGVIVRHLVLPEAFENSKGVLKGIYNIDKKMYVSVMGQYFPTKNVEDHKVLNRRVTQTEYDDVINAFFEIGLKNGFTQDIDSAVEDYVPHFDLNALKVILNIK